MGIQVWERWMERDHCGPEPSPAIHCHCGCVTLVNCLAPSLLVRI